MFRDLRLAILIAVAVPLAIFFVIPHAFGW